MSSTIDAVLPDDGHDAGATDQEVLEVMATCPGALVPCAEGLGVAIDDPEAT
jgi:hypothetical protein